MDRVAGVRGGVSGVGHGVWGVCSPTLNVPCFRPTGEIDSVEVYSRETLGIHRDTCYSRGAPPEGDPNVRHRDHHSLEL